MPEELKMTYTPNTIEHLGVRMYSTLPPVIAELVANAYDADASEVRIRLKDGGEKEIVISDNGHGMSFSDINNKFLRIGRNRRSEEEQQESPGGRKVIGKKGLGKLSFFGIAHEVEVHTIQGWKKNSFKMEWKNIVSSSDKSQQENYSPEILGERDVDCSEEKGTTIILRKIKRSSDFDAESLADSLSKFFIVDAEFNIFVKRNDESEILIDNKRRYSTLDPEIEWNIPNDIEVDLAYKNKAKITGHLMTTGTPISPSTKMKGITLFSRKKLVNNPDYFSESTSSHFYAYLTGWLEVDFIDDIGEDVIGTNRQSLNWEHPEMVELLEYLQAMMKSLGADWREKRAEKRKKELEKRLEEETGVDIDGWRDSTPEEIDINLDPVMDALVKDAELDKEKAVESIKGLQKIIKPYPEFHWHNLHPELHNAVIPYYKARLYYSALLEGVKTYHNAVKSKAGSPLTDRVLLENVFSLGEPKLRVAENIKKPDGGDFSQDTMQNIKEGHRLLVIAMWQAFRCPFVHETMDDIEGSGLYSRQDCLDALGLLSHLFRRLEEAEIVQEGD